MTQPLPPVERRYFTPVEVASILKVHPRTVRGWLNDPNHPLKGAKLTVGWRVGESQFQEYLRGIDD